MVFSQQQAIQIQIQIQQSNNNQMQVQTIPVIAKPFQQVATPQAAIFDRNECSILAAAKNNAAPQATLLIQKQLPHQITTTPTPTTTTMTPSSASPCISTKQSTASSTTALRYKGPFATYLLCIEKLTAQLFASCNNNNGNSGEITCTEFCKKAQDLFTSVANMKQGKHRNKKKTLQALCAASVYHYCKIHRSVSRTIKELLKLMNACEQDNQVASKKNNGAKKQQAGKKAEEDDEDDEDENSVHVQRKQFTHALKLIQQNIFHNGSAVLNKLEGNKQAPLKSAVTAASQVLTRKEMEMIKEARQQQKQQAEIVNTSSPDISSSEEDNDEMNNEMDENSFNDEGTLVMKDDFKEEEVKKVVTPTVVVTPVMIPSPQRNQTQQLTVQKPEDGDLLALANLAVAQSMKLEQSTSSGEAITAQKIDFAKRTLTNVFQVGESNESKQLYQSCLDKCIELFNKFPSRVARTITAVAIFIIIQREQIKLSKLSKSEPSTTKLIKGIPSLAHMTTVEILDYATRTADVNSLSVRNVLKELRVL